MMFYVCSLLYALFNVYNGYILWLSYTLESLFTVRFFCISASAPKIDYWWGSTPTSSCTLLVYSSDLS